LGLHPQKNVKSTGVFEEIFVVEKKLILWDNGFVTLGT
jgi:hypothetical protein